jgi:triosephosphate isomerase
MGLLPILCVGETLEDRDRNQTETVLDRQVRSGLAQVREEDFKKLVLAYEPVWAIGTGRNATPDQAEQACAFIRGIITEIFGENPAQEIPIQYGGSVKPENARSLMSQPDVDGALVGGACIVAEQFLAIIRAALPG